MPTTSNGLADEGLADEQLADEQLADKGGVPSTGGTGSTGGPVEQFTELILTSVSGFGDNVWGGGGVG